MSENNHKNLQIENKGEANNLEKANIDATNSLLDILQSEATGSNTVLNITNFDDNYLKNDATRLPPLNIFRDPENENNEYLIGLRDDGTGQIVMLVRENGGVVGRLELTLKRDQTTVAHGERLEQAKNRFPERHILEGERVSPEILIRLRDTLPSIFEMRRQTQKTQSSSIVNFFSGIRRILGDPRKDQRKQLVHDSGTKNKFEDFS